MNLAHIGYLGLLAVLVDHFGLTIVKFYHRPSPPHTRIDCKYNYIYLCVKADVPCYNKPRFPSTRR